MKVNNLAAVEKDQERSCYIYLRTDSVTDCAGVFIAPGSRSIRPGLYKG